MGAVTLPPIYSYHYYLCVNILCQYPQRAYYTHRKTSYRKPTFRLSIKTISCSIKAKPKPYSTVKSPWFFSLEALEDTGLRDVSFLHLLDLLGFPCAQNRHAMNHIWTMGEILRRIKGVYFGKKIGDSRKGTLK